MANELALYSYCDRIDATVRRWIREPRARQVLALHGYPRLTMLVEPDQEAQLPADAQARIWQKSTLLNF